MVRKSLLNFKAPFGLLLDRENETTRSLRSMATPRPETDSSKSIFDLGLAQITRKVISIEKQIAMADKLEGIIKSRLSK